MNQEIITQELLIKTAGKICFDQGVNQFSSLVISDFHYKNKKIKAQIGQFEVSVHYRKGALEGACSCPMSDGFDFCQHCVCLVLQANKYAQQINTLSKGPDKSKVLAYLLAQDKQYLAKQCLELIERDAEQFKRFTLKAFLNTDRIDFSQLKTQITDLTRKPENLFSQRQVKIFFSKIDLILDELMLCHYLNEAEKMIKLVEYTFQRINQLLISIDDANFQRQDCTEKLQAMYVQLLTHINVRPDTKAKRLYSFWLNDTHNLLDSNIDRYLAQENSLSKFKLIVNNEWKVLMHESKKSTLTHKQQTKLVRYLLESSMQENEHDKIQDLRAFLDKK